ncbi:MAG: AgmX/PglI C-terminal domain-containing protein [Deltaproteobacteria bacterium]|nr:AgmX/PglI C-terminal domain-containing protein [Deltaproteobacteria bacterium]
MTSQKSILLGLVTAAFVLGSGCAGSGFDKAVRTDVESRMTTAQPKFGDCYAEALKRNRKATGTVVVSFVAKANSGKFEDVKVVRSDIGDPQLDKCVIDQISGLTLEKPVKNQVLVEYPIAFSAHD